MDKPSPDSSPKSSPDSSPKSSHDVEMLDLNKPFDHSRVWEQVKGERGKRTYNGASASLVMLDNQDDFASELHTVYKGEEGTNGSSAQLAKRSKTIEELLSGSSGPLEPWESATERKERLKRLASNQVLIKILLDKLFKGYSTHSKKTEKAAQTVSRLATPFEQPRLLTLTDVRVCRFQPITGRDGIGIDSDSDSDDDAITPDDFINAVICFRAGGAIFALKLSSFDSHEDGDGDGDGDSGSGSGSSGHDEARFQYECAKRLIFVNRDKFEQRGQYGICSLANLLEYNRSVGNIRSCRTTSVFGQGGEAVNSLIGSAYRVAGNEHDDWSNECKMMMRALKTANDSHSLEILVADPDHNSLIEILLGLGVDTVGESMDEVIQELWFDADRMMAVEPSAQEEAAVLTAIRLGFESISEMKEAKKKPEDQEDQYAGRRRKYTSKKRSSRKSKTIKKRKNKRTRRQSVEKRRPSARSSRKHSRSNKSR